MDSATKAEIAENDKQIDALQKRKQKLNPFANLKQMSWKEFGEDFSERYILDNVPNLFSAHGAGHDMYSEKLGYIEVKSVRLPCSSGWTFNQLHLDECDYYLFAFYDTVEYEVYLFLVPTKDITDTNKFSISKQHGNGCYSMGKTKKNTKSLQQYRVKSFIELNRRC